MYMVEISEQYTLVHARTNSYLRQIRVKSTRGTFLARNRQLKRQSQWHRRKESEYLQITRATFSHNLTYGRKKQSSTAGAAVSYIT